MNTIASCLNGGTIAINTTSNLPRTDVPMRLAIGNRTGFGSLVGEIQSIVILNTYLDPTANSAGRDIIDRLFGWGCRRVGIALPPTHPYFATDPPG